MRRWKFIKDDLTSHYGAHQWEIGKWYQVNGQLELCHAGFHCASSIYRALTYVNAGILAEVETKGNHILGVGKEGKECWEEMRIVKVNRIDKEVWVKFAIYTAELVVELFEKKYPKDDRPRKAIEAAKFYLEAQDKRAAGEAAALAARGAALAADKAALDVASTEAAMWPHWAAKAAGGAALVASGPESRAGLAGYWTAWAAGKAASLPVAWAFWVTNWPAWVFGAPAWIINKNIALFVNWIFSGLPARKRINEIFDKWLMDEIDRATAQN